MRTTKKLLIIATLAFACSLHTEAQIGKLAKKAIAKNLLKKKKKPGNVANAGKVNSKNSKPTATAIDLDRTTFKFTPSITLYSLLHGTRIANHGFTSFSNYLTTFLPYLTKDGKEAIDLKGFLNLKIYKDGEFKKSFAMEINAGSSENKKRGIQEPSNTRGEDGVWRHGSDIEVNKLGAGKYRLEFVLAGEVFYNFEFEVYKKVSDDPYASESELYFSKGLWNDYAYFTKNTSNNLIFGLFLMHDEFHPNPNNLRIKTKRVKAEIKLTKNGKTLAQRNREFSLDRGKWQEYEASLGYDKSKYMKFDGLSDGNYKMEVKLDNETSKRIYNFTVTNKKINYLPQQDRAKNTDPTRHIEGWNTITWLKKQ